MTSEADKKAKEKPVCGIIMPISAMPPIYDASHWKDVRAVFDTAIEKAGFFPQIVSDSFESDVIQSRIIQNLYSNDVVICDVSGLNANVMFELGVRITFNRPVIVVTDDVGAIPFDTRIIEHLSYPRDLHIHLTQAFIDELSNRIKRISESFKSGKFKTPLDSLGNFEVYKPTTSEVTGEKYIADGIDAIMRRISRLEHDIRLDKSRNGWISGINKQISNYKSLKVTLNKDPSDDIVKRILNNVEGIRTIEIGDRELTINFERDNLSGLEVSDRMRTLEKVIGPAAIVSIGVEP